MGTTTFTGPRNQTAEFLAQYNWADSYMLAHNALFDATILAYRFNIHPKLLLDTLSMARAADPNSAGSQFFIQRKLASVVLEKNRKLVVV